MEIMMKSLIKNVLLGCVSLAILPLGASTADAAGTGCAKECRNQGFKKGKAYKECKKRCKKGNNPQGMGAHQGNHGMNNMGHTGMGGHFNVEQPTGTNPGTHSPSGM